MWTFLTNHAHVLVCIAEDPGVRLRDVASHVGITERAAQSIVADLVRAGYLSRTRVGRRNRYEIHDDRALRHGVESHQSIGGLIGFLRSSPPRELALAAAAGPRVNGNGHNGNGHGTSTDGHALKGRSPGAFGDN